MLKEYDERMGRDAAEITTLRTKVVPSMEMFKMLKVLLGESLDREIRQFPKHEE
jgi:hypothetical protein